VSIGEGRVAWESMTTDWDRSERYEERSLRAEPEIPKVDVSLERRILWSIVSKAAERSKRTRAETFCLFMTSRFECGVRRSRWSEIYGRQIEMDLLKEMIEGDWSVGCIILPLFSECLVPRLKMFLSSSIYPCANITKIRIYLVVPPPFSKNGLWGYCIQYRFYHVFGLLRQFIQTGNYSDCIIVFYIV
jgi:hypothetical protein